MIPSCGRGQGTPRAAQAPSRELQSRIPNVSVDITGYFGLGAPSKAAFPHQDFWPELEAAPAGKGLVLIAMAGMEPELL